MKGALMPGPFCRSLAFYVHVGPPTDGGWKIYVLPRLRVVFGR